MYVKESLYTSSKRAKPTKSPNSSFKYEIDYDIAKYRLPVRVEGILMYGFCT